METEMQYLKHIIMLLTFILTSYCLSPPVYAADKVVVIPMNSAKMLKNVVTVSEKGGDFTNPVSAVSSITDATANNPYLVLIGPGIYTLTQTLLMKPYVLIAGSGQEATTLKGGISSDTYDAASALVSGSDNAVLCDLSIENTGGGKYSMAMYNGNSSPIIRDVTATASGGDNNRGVYNFESSPVMTDMSATASGGTVSNYGVLSSNSSPNMTNVTATAIGGGSGVYNVSSDAIMTEIIATAYGGGNASGVSNSNCSPIMTNVTAAASGGTYTNQGVNNHVSSPIMNNVTATASGGDYSYGVNNSESSPSLTNVTTSASGGLYMNYGVRNYYSSSTIRKCTLNGSTAALYQNVGTTRIMLSSILGGVINFSGTISCVHSDNGVATALNSTCQ
ncbi:MAG: hypothetical protein ACYDBT_07020 [Desulfobulbaceae bacterium]